MSTTRKSPEPTFKPTLNETMFEHMKAEEKTQSVIEPSYYGTKGIQPIDLIEDNDVSFNLGNVIKYSARAGKKNKDTEIEDLQKAQFYLQREISRLVKKKEAK